MPTDAVQAESSTRVSRGPFRIDPDMAAWITARANALHVPEAYVVRQAIRAAMAADPTTAPQAPAPREVAL